ncbi:MAG TPA: RDD family protein [Ornithinibacter sp.]|nr:RDD family protein [Ornithinibacter sp.]
MSDQPPPPPGQQPDPQTPPPPAPPADAVAAPPASYGAPQQPPPYGAPQPPAQNPYGAPQPPAQNPYGGGYGQAPVYAGGPAMHPGSLGYVQANFGQAATFGQRALALIVDWAITLVGLIPMVIGIIMLATAVPSEVYVDEFGTTQTQGGNSSQAAIGGLLIGLGVLISIGITLWNRVFKMGRTGQSVGKKMVGLKLIDDKTGQPIGAGMCFLREVVSSIVNQVVYLSYLWMLWDADKQTLADKAVHSTVVVVPGR